MGKSITREEYVKANLRLKELINIVDDHTLTDDPLAREFMEVTDIIEHYEKIHFPINLPTPVAPFDILALCKSCIFH